jgi:hypothetical protein
MARTATGDKIVVTGEETGALFPTNREETFKEIHVNGSRKAFYITNSAFSPNLKFIGSGTIKGAVFATESIRLENDGKIGVQCFQSGLATHGTIIGESLGDNKISSSVPASMDNARFIIRGDIIAGKSVKLINAIVLGSIFCESLELENSIVFGTCRVKGELIATFSGLSIFRTRSLILNGPIKFFTASGVSIEEPVFNSFNHLGVLYPSIMLYDPLCRYYNIFVDKWINYDDNLKELYDKIELYKTDFIKIDDSNLINKILNKFSFNLSTNEISTIYLFGIEGRGFNMDSVFKRNEVINNIMNGVFIFEHLTNEKKEEVKKLWKENMKEQEINFLEIATQGF